ncbi:MAG: rhodanese-like domain-containing protein [Deltaproteobacteria bacterium]|nr:rhodanese-like domain-containing protein [Deltaproteobacteria bacterium]
MSFRTANPVEAYRYITEQEATYLDVRTPEEFVAGHAKGAVNIPLLTMGPDGRQPNPQFLEQVLAAFPKEAKLVVACAAGGRSTKACEVLSRHGYAHLLNCDGGFKGRCDPSTGATLVKGWEAEGLPVE